MQVRYITDDDGNAKGVYIPISEWREIEKILQGNNDTLPLWQKKILDERLKQYKNNPNGVQEFEYAMDQIEKEL